MLYIERQIITDPSYDAKSAHLMGWAHCMDKIDDIARNTPR